MVLGLFGEYCCACGITCLGHSYRRSAYAQVSISTVTSQNVVELTDLGIVRVLRIRCVFSATYQRTR